MRLSAVWSRSFLFAGMAAAVATRAPAQTSAEAEILFTGKLMGYLRLPHEQSGTHVLDGCPADAGGASPEAREFLDQPQYRKGAKALLLGMGDNFSPELFARIFRPMPPLPNDDKATVRAGLYGKDQFTWIWDRNAPGEVSKGRWVFAGAAGERHPVHQLISEGRSRIPTDNVACFLAAAGYDAVVPGKHDFYFGPERIRSLARFLARRGSAHRVQMVAANLVIRTSFASPTKLVSDEERGIDYVTADPEKKLSPADFSDRGYLLPWVQRLRFKFDGQETPALPAASLHSTQKGDPARRLRREHHLTARWVTDAPGTPEQQHHLELALPEHVLQPGSSYAVCLEPAAQAPAGKAPARDYCARFTVDHPFFHHPWDNDGKEYTDPEPYLWKCLDGSGQPGDGRTGTCGAGHTEVAVFGVVDPELKEHVGQLNYGWLNDDDRETYKTEIEVLDPYAAIQQLEQLFEREHPGYTGLKVLLAQMSLPRAQQLASKLRGRFHVVIAEAQAEHATANVTVSVPGTSLRPFVAVPMPFYNPVEKKPAFSLRTLKVTRTPLAGGRDQWSYALTGERHDVSPLPDKVADQEWVRRGIYTGRNRVLPSEPPLGWKTPKPGEFAKEFTDYALRVMKETADADVALLQKRDFFFEARLTRQEIAEENLALAIDRLLWKGDLLVKRTLPGKALKEVLKRSKEFDDRDASQLSLDVERKRGLVTLGITHDARRDQYIVNGEPLDEGRLYTVATTDYAALGDTGYPELVTEAVGGPRLARDFDYLCPLHLIVHLAIPNGDYDDARCAQALRADEYLDHLEGEPRDLQADTYFRRLVRWVLPNPSRDDPWASMTPMEEKSQLRRSWFVSLKKAAISGNITDNNVSEAEREDRFKGSNLPQVQAAESEFLSFAGQGTTGLSWPKADLFASFDLAHTRTSTSRRDVPALLNYADNRLVTEVGVFYRIQARTFPRFGPQLSLRMETQLFQPNENLTLADGSTFSFRRERTFNFQVPRLGFRWQGRENQLQLGVEYSQVERVDAYDFLDPVTGARATCILDPSRPGYEPNCVKNRSDPQKGDPPPITARSRVTVSRSWVGKPGVYASARIALPEAAKVSFVSEHDYELFKADDERDLPSMTRWRWLMTHGVRFKPLANFAITPKLEVFLYKNQRGQGPSAQHSFRQYKTSVELSYSFDWHRGNPGGAAGYKKPEK